MIDSEAVFGTFSLVIKKRKAFININVKDYERELPTAVKWFIVYIQCNYRIRKYKQCHVNVIDLIIDILITGETAVRGQNALTLSLDIAEESDFSDTAYNSTYVIDVQSLIAKSMLQQVFV